MTDRAKKMLYWLINILLLPAGLALRLLDILPVVNASIFLLGLYWTWAGISSVVKINPYFGKNFSRKLQLALCASSIGMGIAWVIISFTELSHRALPMLAVSIPFVLLDLILAVLNMKK